MRLRRGTEPVTARSAYDLRRVLAWLALVGGGIGAAGLGMAATEAGEAAIGWWVASALCALIALSAVVDLLVIGKRSR